MWVPSVQIGRECWFCVGRLMYQVYHPFLQVRIYPFSYENKCVEVRVLKLRPPLDGTMRIAFLLKVLPDSALGSVNNTSVLNRTGHADVLVKVAVDGVLKQITQYPP